MSGLADSYQTRYHEIVVQCELHLLNSSCPEAQDHCNGCEACKDEQDNSILDQVQMVSGGGYQVHLGRYLRAYPVR